MAPGGVEDAGTSRIVSMVPSLTETFFEIGAGEQLVGVSEFCRYPESARKLPSVGGFLNPSIEKILALQPGVVVISDSQNAFSHKLTELGIFSVTVRTDSLSDVYSSIRLAGALAHRQGKAEVLAARLQHGMKSLKDEWSTASQPRVLVVVGRQPGALQGMYAAGQNSYLGELLAVVNAHNVAPAGSLPYVPITKEQIVSANPAVIIDTSLGEAGENPAIREAHRRAWRQLSVIDAVRSGRIHYLTDPRMTIPGPGIVTTAETVARLVHGGKAD
jgi:iron complex transport system substrate-binding protein